MLLCRVLLRCALWFRALWFRALWFRALWFRALWFPGRGFSRTDVPGSRPLLRALLLWGLLGRLWLRGAAGGSWTAPAPGLQQRLLVEAARLPDLLVRACRAVGLPRSGGSPAPRGPKLDTPGPPGDGWGAAGAGSACRSSVPGHMLRDDAARKAVFSAAARMALCRSPVLWDSVSWGRVLEAGVLGARVPRARVLEARFLGVRSLGVRVLGAAVLGRVPRVGRTRGACCFRPSFTRSDLGRACVRYDGARRMIRARAVALLFVRWGR